MGRDVYMDVGIRGPNIPDMHKFQELHRQDEMTWHFPYNGYHSRRTQ